METLVTGTVVGARYTVVQVLGQGGMAVVYEVMNHQLGTPCALKVLTLTARSVQARLKKEGQVQSRLAHPNVVTVFDVIDVEGCPGLLMELVRGPSLDELLSEQRLTFEQCDALARGIFAGMTAAHEAGLIHRDLKPANILCSIANGALIPKIADFGLAKTIGDESGANVASATRSGTTMGTPSYMAPEQIRTANKVDQRADVFSLGAILYEMVCGRKAFEGEDLLDLFTAVAAGKYTPPRELRPDLPERMERAIVAALTPNRDERVRDIPSLAAVWSGEREDWTAEIDGSTLTSLGPWDAGLLSKYRSGASTSNPGRTTSQDPAGSQRLTPMAPSARSPVSGITYTEEVPMTAPPAVRRRGPRSLVPLLAVALLAVVAVSVAAGGAFYLAVGPHLGPALRAWLDEPEPIAPATSDEEDVGLAKADVVEGVETIATPPPSPVVVLAPADPPVAPHPAAPRPERTPAPLPPPEPEVVPVAPAPPEPTPAAPEFPPDQGRVLASGDARRVFLQGPVGGDSRNHALPANLVPGTYAIEVFFKDGEPISAGSITVVAGKKVSVHCSSSMRTCKPR